MSEERICTSCKSNRAKTGLAPKPLLQIPGNKIRGKVFKRSMSAWVCRVCDGPCYEHAAKAHELET